MRRRGWFGRTARRRDNQPLERTAAAVYYWLRSSVARAPPRPLNGTTLCRTSNPTFRGFERLLAAIEHGKGKYTWYQLDRAVVPDFPFSNLHLMPTLRELLATASGGRLVSGPSGYVFDRAGLLVDWSPDVMDDRAFQQRWEPLRRRDAGITVDEAQAWLRDRGAGG